MNKLDVLPTREYVIHNCPFEKNGFSRSNRQMAIFLTYLIIIANAKQIKKCKRINGMGESEGIICNRGRRTSSFRNLSFKKLVSRTLPFSFKFSIECILHETIHNFCNILPDITRHKSSIEIND